jgi:hypothetical protein
VWVLIPLAGFAFGLALGRWWALVGVVPLPVWILASNDVEGHIALWIAAMLSLLLVCAIGSGVALRRLSRRSLRRA